LPAASAQSDLGNQDGNGNKDYDQKVNQHKGAAAVCTGHVRKLPDIAQAYSSADRGQQESQAGRPVFMLFEIIDNLYSWSMH
jgi:hypothetical protein